MGLNNSSLSSEARVAASKFDEKELRVLRKTFKDLASRSDGKSIDKRTLLQYIPLPGLFGERLFDVFDTKGDGAVDLEEFICGMGGFCRGSFDEKVEHFFRLCDLDEKGSISREELGSLLSHIPRDILTINHDISDDKIILNSESKEDMSTYTMNQMSLPNNSRKLTKIDSQTIITSREIVDRAFEECNLNRDGKLSLEQFRIWIEKTPEILRFFDSVLPFSSHGGGIYFLERGQTQRIINSNDFSEASDEEIEILETETHDYLVKAYKATKNPLIRSEISRVIQMLTNTTNKHKNIELTIQMEGFLSKVGQKSRMWKHRWFVLVGNFVYYYFSQNDPCPRGVIFMAGSFVEKLNDPESENHGYYGFEIIEQTASGAPLRKEFFARSESLRDIWISKLKQAAHVIEIEQEYEIGEELGKGRFSTVYNCRKKETDEYYAVKVIDKRNLRDIEKELLRTEIAILKLVHHPHIIQTFAIFETLDHIYIVMEKLVGGELFNRIVGRPRFTEVEAIKVIKPILESVAYLHELGIAHRDIKPENILCGVDLEDIKIADFGLSKLVTPEELMTQACGTLTYVAPEVLSGEGYGRGADLWSVGVIMFLILRGRLPFSGVTREETIERILNGELDIKNDKIFNDLSESARDLILQLLARNVKERITAQDALHHPWILRLISTPEN